MPQPHFPLVQVPLLLQKPERGKEYPPGLLLHDEVEQDRKPDERDAGDQNGVHDGSLSGRRPRRQKRHAQSVVGEM